LTEALRQQRVLHEYRLRGYSSEQAFDVYLARQADAFPVIEELAGGATRISLTEVLG
jgi:hypothetical protein